MSPILLCLFAATGIGSELQLFVDETQLSTLTNVELELHHPQPKEIVLEFEKPWEGSASAYVTFFKDEHIYRCYYRGLADEKSLESTCTAISTDGIHWTKPEVGLFEVYGAKANNVVWLGPETHNFCPFLDANPDASPEQKYKAVGGQPLIALTSSDGYQWTRLQDAPILSSGQFDSQNLAFWHPLHHRYECYMRDWTNNVRSIRMSTSDDFVTWSEPQPLDFGNAPVEHLYTNAISPYFRAPRVYVGFPKRFMPDRYPLPNLSPSPGISDAVFMTSRDGLHWNRWPEAFIRPGRDPENWTHRNIMPAWGLLELTPGEISIYYSEHYEHPTAHIRRGVLRTDGFVSLSADGAEGTATTQPLTFAGSKLRVNIETSAAGYIRIEIQDENEQPIPGFELDQCDEIYGDDLGRVVAWSAKSDVAALAGRNARIKFVMKDADIYSFKFE